MVEFRIVDLDIPEGCNVILGYSHFIKTVEDLNEIIRTHIPSAKYALAFSEASGDRLVRFEGNDDSLVSWAIEAIKKLSAGHTFIVVMKNAYPIQVLNDIKNCQEVGRIFAATANPLSVLTFSTTRGWGIAGVVDGYSPLGVESEEHKNKRKQLLRDIGYKS